MINRIIKYRICYYLRPTVIRLCRLIWQVQYFIRRRRTTNGSSRIEKNSHTSLVRCSVFPSLSSYFQLQSLVSTQSEFDFDLERFVQQSELSFVMSFLGSNIVGDVGLRLLLGPLDTNIVVRTACCTVGTVLPVYTTFKAIERKDQNEQEKWLIYWAAYGSFSLIEVFTDKLLYWFPLYYHFKFAFLVWLQLPSTDGAKQLYVKHLRPLLSKYEDRLDQVLGFTYHEMAKLVSAHQGEIQLIRNLINKIMGSVDHIFRGQVKPSQPRILGSTPTETRAIEGPSPESNDEVSDHED